MISTQRLIITIVMLSFVLAFAGSLHGGVNKYNNAGTAISLDILGDTMSQTSAYKDLNNASDEDINNESMYGGINTENPVQENQPFNVLSWGGVLWRFFGYALIPLPIGFENTSTWNVVEKYAYNVINWFRFILVALVYLEIFLIWKNKKNS